MAFGAIDSNSAWDARIAAEVIRPALFVYLDWPTGAVRASTHYETVTALGESWTGVGNLAKFDAAPFEQSGALVTYTIGLTSVPQGTITDATENEAIGRRAEIYLGLFNQGWLDPELRRIFIGHVMSTGDFRMTLGDDGNWVVSASVRISNGRSPRRQLETHHSPETAESGDTFWRHLPLVGRSMPWPTQN